MNKKKTYFIISDVHGFYTPMITALDKAGFNSENEQHVLVSLGDNFDRGPDAIAVYNYLKYLPRTILIKGNHEDLLERCYVDKSYNYADEVNGTVDTISQFAKNNISITKLFFKDAVYGLKTYGVLDWISTMKDYVEIGNNILTHGWLPYQGIGDTLELIPDWRENATTEDWKKCRFANSPILYKANLLEDNKTLICGHWKSSDFHGIYETVDNDNSIFYGKNFIDIDATTVRSKLVNVYKITSRD